VELEAATVLELPTKCGAGSCNCTEVTNKMWSWKLQLYWSCQQNVELEAATVWKLPTNWSQPALVRCEGFSMVAMKPST
jgi:hypothetical protein